MRVRILLLPRVRIQRITFGIRAILLCSISIFCSSPFLASQQPQPSHSSPYAQASSSSFEAALSPHSSSPVVRHVRRAVSAPDRLKHAESAGGRACRGRETRVSGGRDCCSGGKGVEVGSGGAGSSQSEGKSSGGSRCSTCSGSGGRGSVRQR